MKKFWVGSVVVLLSCIGNAQANTNTEAKRHMEAVKESISRGERLLRTNPSTAAIGQHSREMRLLVDEGRQFQSSSSLNACAGVGATAWTFWYSGLLARFNRDASATKDFQPLKSRYMGSLKECQSAIKAK